MPASVADEAASSQRPHQPDIYSARNEPLVRNEYPERRGLQHIHGPTRGLSRQISTFPLAAGVTRNLSNIVASFREDDSMAEDVAARYVLAGGVDTVHGWLGGGAITATLVIHDWQVRNNVQGNVAEIGIHHGKYFLVLKNLCRPEEIAIAIDVFEDQHLN